MTPAKKSPANKRITEPVKDTAAPIEPPAPAAEAVDPIKAAVHALLQTLGHGPEDVVSLEVTGRHIRVYGKDRSLRSHRIEGIE